MPFMFSPVGSPGGLKDVEPPQTTKLPWKPCSLPATVGFFGASVSAGHRKMLPLGLRPGSLGSLALVWVPCVLYGGRWLDRGCLKPWSSETHQSDRGDP